MRQALEGDVARMEAERGGVRAAHETALTALRQDRDELAKEHERELSRVWTDQEHPQPHTLHPTRLLNPEP